MKRIPVLFVMTAFLFCGPAFAALSAFLDEHVMSVDEAVRMFEELAGRDVSRVGGESLEKYIDRIVDMEMEYINLVVPLHSMDITRTESGDAVIAPRLIENGYSGVKGGWLDFLGGFFDDEDEDRYFILLTENQDGRYVFVDENRRYWDKQGGLHLVVPGDADLGGNTLEDLTLRLWFDVSSDYDAGKDLFEFVRSGKESGGTYAHALYVSAWGLTLEDGAGTVYARSILFDDEG